MGVAYSSPDSQFTRITAVYSCSCGAAVAEVGRHAGRLPPGWERASDEKCRCEHCAELKRAAEARRPGAAPSAWSTSGGG